MKNKIRLTESQLHQVIKEVISEAVADPRTWFLVADKHEKDGTWTPQQIQRARQRGVEAWNEKYGQTDSQYTDDSQYHNRMYMGNTVNGNVDVTHTRDYQTPNDSGTVWKHYQFNPRGNNSQGDYSWTSTSKDPDTVASQERYDKNYHYGGNEGLNVAKQMAYGNGKRIRGKGWQ